MQLFIWHDSTTVNRWCNELYTVYHEINRLKNNKNILKKRLYFKKFGVVGKIVIMTA